MELSADKTKSRLNRAMVKLKLTSQRQRGALFKTFLPATPTATATSTTCGGGAHVGDCAGGPGRRQRRQTVELTWGIAAVEQRQRSNSRSSAVAAAKKGKTKL